jgi:hypothetical protein
MSVDLEILLRLERGELAAEEAAEVRRALAGDAQAREWLAWIRGARRGTPALLVPDPAWEGSAVADAGAAPDPADVAALAEGRLAPDEARAVRAALARCDDGPEMLLAALTAARDLAGDVERAVPAAPPRPVPAVASQRRPLARDPRTWLVAAAAAAVILLVLWPDRDGAPRELGAVARIEALAVNAVRGDASARERGLEAYARADFAAAIAALSAATAADGGDGEAWLYLGSALLLESRAPDAAPALEAAAAAAKGPFAEEARWQLAQARLALADGDAARAQLERIASGDGHRAPDARDQLGELDGGD